MKGEVIILNALLDNCDLHTIGQDFAASWFIPSNLHLELIQRTPHITFEGLCQNLEQLRRFSASCCRLCASSATLHHRLHVPASAALNPPRAVPTCCTAAFRNDSNQKTACAHSINKVPRLSQQHRHGGLKIQVHTNQLPQIPMFSLVPFPKLPSTTSTHFAPDKTQRVATKHVFHQLPSGR